MLYQLPNGKYIEIDSELYFQLTDDDIQDLIALDFGKQYHDPFDDSVIIKGEIHCYIEDDIIDDIEVELYNISKEDKIIDTDFIYLDDIEI